MVVLRVLLLVWVCQGRAAAISGLYVDNGLGMTVLEDKLSKQDLRTLEYEMLDIFGLQGRPPMMHRRHRSHKADTSKSAPKFLLEVMKALDDRGLPDPTITSVQLAKSQVDAVGEADTIITFVNKHHNNPNIKHNSRNKYLYFDMTDVSLEHSLLEAELRLYRKPNITKNNLTLHVYKITGENGNITGETSAHRQRMPDSGWMTVNVTAIALSWLIFPQTNFGLRLAITEKGFKHELHFHDEGVTGSRDEEDLAPFIVGFFLHPRHNLIAQHLPHLNRAKRNAARASRFKRSPKPPPFLAAKPPTQCKRSVLFVSFADLSWQDWVIAPQGYEAFYCSGRCNFPITSEMNATNHALVQTLVLMMRGDEQERPPPPCCAPTDLATISVLYYDYSQNVVLKKYPRMIVKSCGCQ